MAIRPFQFRNLWKVGLPMAVFAFASMALLVHRLRTNPTANGTATGFVSFLGAVLFMLGILLCMGSCMLRDAEADLVPGTWGVKISLSTSVPGRSGSKSRYKRSTDG